MKIIQRAANFNWIAAVLYPLMVILMEVFWIYPWLTWLGKWDTFVWQRPSLSPLSLIFLLSASYFITKFFFGRRWSIRRTQLGVVSCSLAVIFIVIRIDYGAGFKILSGQWFVHTTQIFLNSYSQFHPIVIAVAIAFYLCWRGISWGRSPLSFSDIYGAFCVGLTALVVLIILSGITSGAGIFESVTSTTGIYVAGFFFFSLMAMAISHMQTIRRKVSEEEVKRVISSRWLSTMVGIIGGIVLVGIGIASMFSPDFVALLMRTFSLASSLLLKVLHYLLIPIEYLALAIDYIGRFIVSLFRPGEALQVAGTANFSAIEGLPEVGTPRALSPEALLAIKWTLFALIIIAASFLLARAILRYRALIAEAEVEEIHESLWSWQGFRADLLLFLSLFKGRFKRKKKMPVPVSPVPSWYTTEDMPDTLSIREIYKRLLWEASYLRMPRWHHETPYEYARRLGQTLPDANEQVADLTNLYIGVRYGNLEVEDKQVNYANSLWRIIKRLFQKVEGNQQVK